MDIVVYWLKKLTMRYNLEILQPNTDEYELLDSGEGEKLERYGKYILRRPDPQALWHKAMPKKDWEQADATFARDGLKNEWILTPGLPKEWPITFGENTFIIRPTPFKHTGIFPEQRSNWDWMKKVIASAKRDISVLNLFAYTGGATLAALAAGANVCHVDGSKKAIAWARQNTEASHLSDKPVRWILDDAITFAKRELRRGKCYDGIILDPPSFGHGPKGESWLIENDFLSLIDVCGQLLSKNPAFILINGYAAGYSALAYKNCIQAIIPKAHGNIEAGELLIPDRAGRLLSCGIYSRWSPLKLNKE